MELTDLNKAQEERETRVKELIDESHATLNLAIQQIEEQDKKVKGIVILFSGGNDSTTLAHLFKNRATHAAHANTSIGIEQTRQYVRDTCKGWGLPLIEIGCPEGETYKDLVLGKVKAKTGPNKGRAVYPGGFPGPSMHYIMYTRLKERALHKVRAQFIENPRRERVIFLAGRRASESPRRKRLATISPIERRGSVVWVSGIVNWTKTDLTTYRQMYPDVPRNEVSDLLHMSGECLCGAFAHYNELNEIRVWFPEVAKEIEDLECQVRALGTIPEEKCQWGWGQGREMPSKVGPMCSSCDEKLKILQENGNI